MAKATIAFIVLLLAVNTYCDVQILKDLSRIFKDVQELLADPDYRFKKLGCYQDRQFGRAMGSRSPQKYNWNTVEKCYKRAKSMGQDYFAVQNNNECYTSRYGTYAKYGTATGCRRGRGGSMKNSVYKVNSAPPPSPSPTPAPRRRPRPPTPGVSCAKRGVDYLGYDLKSRFKGGPRNPSKAVSWSACGSLCQSTNECYGWTYTTQQFRWFPNWCFLKNAHYEQNRKYGANLISGSKACVGSKKSGPILKKKTWAAKKSKGKVSGTAKKSKGKVTWTAKG